MDEGRSTTSPAAMPATTASSRARIGSAEDKIRPFRLHARGDGRSESFVSAPAGERARDFLAGLDAGLVERVDREQAAGHERLDLEQMEELPDHGFVEP